MLIEFSVSNFRSIRERQTLSLVASTGGELSETNTYAQDNKLPRLLRSAVIYGPNAAGKSNLVRAVQFAQTFVVNSAVQFQEGNKIPVSPFAFALNERSKPTEIDFIFAEDGTRYHYGFGVTQERVIKEWLVAYPLSKPQRWFERIFNPDAGIYEWNFGPNFEGEKAQQRVWRDATRSNALFLSTAIQLNNNQLKPIFNWIQTKLAVIVPGQEMNPFLSLALLQDPSKKEYINQFMKAVDVGIENLEMKEEELQMLSSTAAAGMSLTETPSINISISHPPGAKFFPPKVLRVFAFHKQVDAEGYVPIDFGEESDGTKKFFEFSGGWIKALQEGATIFVDELDRSLHPFITRFLVNLFHDKTKNRLGSQLVFTTHDTTLLDTELFRRDQVWFVEKDRSASTRLYPLLDYSPRKDEALQRGYLKGRYGAIPFIGPINF